MTLAPGDLYWKRSPYEVDWFISVMAQFPMLDFFQPSPAQAPWHVQCRLPGTDAVINIWPHTGKSHLEGEPLEYLTDGFKTLVLKGLEPAPPLLEDEFDHTPAPNPVPDTGDDIPF